MESYIIVINDQYISKIVIIGGELNAHILTYNQADARHFTAKQLKNMRVRSYLRYCGIKYTLVKVTQ